MCIFHVYHWFKWLSCTRVNVFESTCMCEHFGNELTVFYSRIYLFWTIYYRRMHKLGVLMWMGSTLLELFQNNYSTGTWDETDTSKFSLHIPIMRDLFTSLKFDTNLCLWQDLCPTSTQNCSFITLHIPFLILFTYHFDSSQPSRIYPVSHIRVRTWARKAALLKGSFCVFNMRETTPRTLHSQAFFIVVSLAL